MQPAPATIALIQDKHAQKVFLRTRGVPLADFVDVSAGSVDGVAAAVRAAGARFGYPLMLKAKRMAYDGKGNAVVASADAVETAIASLCGRSSPTSSPPPSLYVEQWAPYTKELAVMVAKGAQGEPVAYDVVETVQADNICSLVVAPAQCNAAVKKAAVEVALNAVRELEGCGVFGVELFLLENGRAFMGVCVSVVCAVRLSPPPPPLDTLQTRYCSTKSHRVHTTPVTSPSRHAMFRNSNSTCVQWPVYHLAPRQ